jgi:magnesium transporter
MDFRRRQQHLRAALGLRRPRISRIRPGAPPGTLVVSESAQPPVIEVRTFGHEGIDEQRVATIDAALGRLAPGTVTWINIDGLGDSGVLSRLGERLGLHPLALEDVLNVPQRPKVERFDKHMFVVMRTMRLERPQGVDAASVTPTIVDEQVSLFFGADWVVTIQERSDGDCFEAVREALRHGRGRARDAGADYLAYLLADAVIDAYFPVLDELAERMHALEEEALAPMSSEGTLSRLTRLRHDLMTVRRAVWPMREVATVLQREETSLVTAETRVFLRDAYDHAVQALEIVESLRETAVSVMEVFLSVQNQRLNEVMKVLTVVSTVMMPLTLLVGAYGMNVPLPQFPGGERMQFWWLAGIMIAISVAMLAMFRRKRWI